MGLWASLKISSGWERVWVGKVVYTEVSVWACGPPRKFDLRRVWIASTTFGVCEDVGLWVSLKMSSG